VVAAAHGYEDGSDASVTPSAGIVVRGGECSSQQAVPAPNEESRLPGHEVSVRFCLDSQSPIDEDLARERPIRQVVDDDPTAPESASFTKPCRSQAVVVEQDEGEWSGSDRLLWQSGADRFHFVFRGPRDTHDAMPAGLKRRNRIAVSLPRREPGLHPMACELFSQGT
jgi:hypothetical protein